MLKYKKMPPLKENPIAYVILLWCMNAIVMAVLFCAQRMHIAHSALTQLLLGFIWGMLVSQYACYKLHNINEMIRQLKEASDAYFEEMTLLFKAQNIINEKEERGF